MTIVVGVDPDGHSRASLHLSAMFARSAGEDLVVCAVLPQPWPPSPARVDAEYRGHLERMADEALALARDRLPDDVPAEYLHVHARSAPGALIDLAERREARVIVVGSSANGPMGRVSLGSVGSRLMHSSPIPVGIAPRGFRTRPAARVVRVTAAYGGSEGAGDLVVAAGEVAAQVGASLRVASFAVRPRAPYTVAVGTEADQSMVSEWAEQIEAAARAALDEVRDLPEPPRELEAVVGYGEDWDDAIEDVDWQEGDVLVVGSSSIGPIARVFLGSRAAKIVRHSPVPVVIVPRRS